jgi:hypothetical protein
MVAGFPSSLSWMRSNLQGGRSGIADVAGAGAARKSYASLDSEARWRDTHHQAENEILPIWYTCTVMVQRIFRRCSTALILPQFHVDEVDDDQATQATQLAGYFFRPLFAVGVLKAVVSMSRAWRGPS